MKGGRTDALAGAREVLTVVGKADPVESVVTTLDLLVAVRMADPEASSTRVLNA